MRARSYQGLPNHASVNHGVGEYVRQQAHTNGLESFWSMMKRGLLHGTYHRMSPAHLQRYVNESASRHNMRRCDTEVQMRLVVQGMKRKRLRYKDLKVGASTMNETEDQRIIPFQSPDDLERDRAFESYYERFAALFRQAGSYVPPLSERRRQSDPSQPAKNHPKLLQFPK